MNSTPYNIEHVRLTPEQQIGAHRQPTWELSYVVRGHGVRIIEGRSEPFRAGELVLVAPGQTHEWRFHNDGVAIENITFVFSTGMIESLAAALPDAAPQLGRLRDLDHAILFNHAATKAIVRKMNELEGQTGTMGALTAWQIIVLLSEAEGGVSVGETRTKTEAELRMEKIVTYMHCNFHRAISLDDVARHVGMNRSSVCAFYRRLTGRTLFADLNALRISHAQFLLRTTARPVTVIAYQSGFGDVPYFNRVFKREVGLSPSEWRDEG